jgi:hypothetical protein
MASLELQPFGTVFLLKIAIGENDATHPSYLSGPMDTQKVKVQFSPIV